MSTLHTAILHNQVYIVTDTTWKIAHGIKHSVGAVGEGAERHDQDGSVPGQQRNKAIFEGQSGSQPGTPRTRMLHLG